MPSPQPLPALMLSLLQCAEEKLNEAERPVGLAHLAPGAAVAWDNCCEGKGQLWVRVIQLLPNTGAASNQPCGIDYMQAQIGIGVMRCAHTIDDDGVAPTAAEMTADTLNVQADQNAVLDAIGCCFTGGLRKVINNWLPQGPLGGCVGGEWVVTIGYDPCMCVEIPEESP